MENKLTKEEIEAMIKKLANGELSQDEQIQLLGLLDSELDKILEVLRSK